MDECVRNRMGGADIDCSSLYSICIPDIFAQHMLREMEYCGLVSHSVFREALRFYKKAPREIVTKDTPSE